MVRSTHQLLWKVSRQNNEKTMSLPAIFMVSVKAIASLNWTLTESITCRWIIFVERSEPDQGGRGRLFTSTELLFAQYSGDARLWKRKDRLVAYVVSRISMEIYSMDWTHRLLPRRHPLTLSLYLKSSHWPQSDMIACAGRPVGFCPFFKGMAQFGASALHGSGQVKQKYNSQTRRRLTCRLIFNRTFSCEWFCWVKLHIVSVAIEIVISGCFLIYRG